MKNKVFAPVDAEKCLPLVRVIVRDIIKISAKLNSLSIENIDEINETLEVREELARLLVEIEAMGCFYKAYSDEVGHVEFPSEIKGKTVHLCWKSDEDHVLYYHKIGDPIEKRKPIPQDLLNHLQTESTGAF